MVYAVGVVRPDPAVSYHDLPRFVALLTTAALAPAVPGVEEVTKGTARRQHWITVWLSIVTRAGAVRKEELVGDWDRAVEVRTQSSTTC